MIAKELICSIAPTRSGASACRSHVSAVSRFSVILFCGLVGGGCLTTVYQIGAHTDNVEFLRTQQAPVRISGTVEDDRGNPLQGVTVRFIRKYQVASYQNFPVGYDRQSEGSRTVNGSFNFEWNVAQQVCLSFEKSGYQSAQVTLDVQNTLPASYYGMTSQPAEPLVRKDVQVVLKVVRQPN